MSNLKLPKMSYENLSTMKVGRTGKIGYATHIERFPGVVYILHHGSKIGKVTADTVSVNNAGWWSNTTTDRMSRILRDNGVPVAVGITNFEQVFRQYRPGYTNEFPVPHATWVDFRR